MPGLELGLSEESSRRPSNQHLPSNTVVSSYIPGCWALQLNLPVWLNNSQAPELAWHWDMHPGAPELWNATGSGSGSGKCVAMGIQNQLMSAHHCANRFPYICQRKRASGPSRPDDNDDEKFLDSGARGLSQKTVGLCGADAVGGPSRVDLCLRR